MLLFNLEKSFFLRIVTISICGIYFLIILYFDIFERFSTWLQKEFIYNICTKLVQFICFGDHSWGRSHWRIWQFWHLWRWKSFCKSFTENIIKFSDVTHGWSLISYQIYFQGKHQITITLSIRQKLCELQPRRLLRLETINYIIQETTDECVLCRVFASDMSLTEFHRNKLTCWDFQTWLLMICSYTQFNTISSWNEMLLRHQTWNKSLIRLTTDASAKKKTSSSRESFGNNTTKLI